MVSFEANPTILDQLNSNIVKNAQFNCFVVHRAVSQSSDEYLSMGEFGAASRIGVGDSYVVRSISLDDFCSEYPDLNPTLIKIDIEGGEEGALRGATRLIESQRPIIIFEHERGQDGVLEFIRSLNYWTMDASLYVPIESSADLQAGRQIGNVLAVPTEKLAGTRYSKPALLQSIAFPELETGVSQDGVTHSTKLLLPIGRYIFRITGHIPEGKTIFTRASLNGAPLAQLWTESSYFMTNHRDLVFHTDHDGVVLFEVGEIETTTPNFTDLKGSLSKIQFGA